MISQKRVDTKLMKTAVKATMRFPFCLLTVSVDPITGPLDQLIQVPKWTLGSTSLLAVSILGTKVGMNDREEGAIDSGGSIPRIHWG